MVADGKIPPGDVGFGSSRTYENQKSAQAFSAAIDDITAAWSAAKRYLAAQADRVKLAAQTVILLTLVGILALVFAVTIFVCSAVLLMNGTADGLTALLGGRQWAGDLITGSVVLLGTLAVGYIAVKKFFKTSRHRTMLNYNSSRNSN